MITFFFCMSIFVLPFACCRLVACISFRCHLATITLVKASSSICLSYSLDVCLERFLGFYLLCDCIMM